MKEPKILKSIECFTNVSYTQLSIQLGTMLFQKKKKKKKKKDTFNLLNKNQIQVLRGIIWQSLWDCLPCLLKDFNDH